jgi:hypothetical protein
MKVDLELLRAAREGFRDQLRSIQERISEIDAELNGSGTVNRREEGVTVIKRNLSPAARKRISEAVKKRWASYRKEKPRSASAA